MRFKSILINWLTPAKIVLEVGFQKARTCLEKDAFQSVSEVGYAIGIQTPGYFSNRFFRNDLANVLRAIPRRKYLGNAHTCAEPVDASSKRDKWSK